MDDKKTIGERIDAVVEKVSGKVESAKDKLAETKDNIADTAHDISNNVKKAVVDSSSAISDLTHNKIHQDAKKETLKK